MILQKLQSLKHDVVYIVTKCSSCGPFNVGDHIWVASTSPEDVNCVEGGGWIDFDTLSTARIFEVDECLDWAVVTTSKGTRAFKITDAWVLRQKEIIRRYESAKHQ